MSPLRLYLISAVIFFLVWPLASEAQGEFFMENVTEGMVAGMLQGAELAELPEERQMVLVERLIAALQILLLFVSVPLLAAINRGPWSADSNSLVLQLTFSLHFHAVALAATGASIVLGTLWEPARNPLVVSAVLFLYVALAIRGAFTMGWRFSITRGFALYFAYSFTALTLLSVYAMALILLEGTGVVSFGA